MSTKVAANCRGASGAIESGQILKSGIAVIGATVFLKGVDFVKNIISVSRFGVTAQGDLYSVVLSIPEFVVVSMGLDTVRGAATTYFTELITKNDRAGAASLLSSLISWAAVVATFFVILGWWLMPYLVHFLAGGFSGDKLAETIGLAYIILPVLFLRILIGIFVSALSANNVFGSVTLLNVITSVSVLGALLVCGDEHLARSVCTAYTIGYSAYVASLAFLARRHLAWRLSFHRPPPAFWSVVKFSSQLALGMVMTQLAGIAEQRTASFFPDGTVASLVYANNLAGQMVFLGILSMFSIMQRRLAQQVASGRNEQAISELWNMMSYVMYVIAFGVAFLIILRFPLLRVMYRRNAFTEEAVGRIAGPLIVYGIWVLAQAVALPVTSFMLAHRKSRIIVIGNVLGFGGDILLVGFFAVWFGYIGIAIGALFAICCHGAVLLIGLRASFGTAGFKGASAVVRILGAGIVTGVIMSVSLNTFNPVYAAENPFTILLAVTAIGFAAYYMLTSALGVNRGLAGLQALRR